MVVLITGAGGGLGSAVLKAFLESGATSVYGVERSWKKHPTEDPRFRALEADLLNPEECNRVAERAKPVDVLVHTVGGFAGGQPVSGITDQDWKSMFDVNLTAAFYMFRAVLPQMLDHKRGRIVAIGSRAAVDLIPNFAAYSVSKAALVALVKTMALELKDSGVTANVVLPSVIDTPANRAANPGADYSKWVAPESIANLLVWLTSGRAADINGAVLPIYGRA